MQEEGPITVPQASCGFVSVQPATWVVAKDKDDFNPSCRRRKGNHIEPNHAKKTGLVGKGLGRSVRTTFFGRLRGIAIQIIVRLTRVAATARLFRVSWRDKSGRL
ncbi:hypothetical protein [Candidatus Methylacidithermus pantelleriae]|uniref:Uncharacterized protein n=1 Tax=Candidatus Methylacidithermus pantelleriae TaxID=2744239 RepID=A0A8J2FP59_9BACT|nr:hypothetical protein [Candidatus Methylacidithermus pantelleriae]CAF0696259.1 hypothetical protein MPNT_20168 [Candidatus Methylacidithermus pantelleriae]